MGRWNYRGWEAARGRSELVRRMAATESSLLRYVLCACVLLSAPGALCFPRTRCPPQTIYPVTE